MSYHFDVLALLPRLPGVTPLLMQRRAGLINRLATADVLELTAAQRPSSAPQLMHQAAEIRGRATADIAALADDVKSIWSEREILFAAAAV